jgi:5S rRNA maturation endonuclease (ribonuclease M5)
MVPAPRPAPGAGSGGSGALMLRQSRREPWPEFLRLWSRFLDEVNFGGRLVLVEGERDRTSLQRLGVSGPVILLHHGARLSHVAEELSRSRRPVTILTDWDAEGGHLAHKLRELLPAQREVDFDLRRRIGVVLRGEVTHVEGLYRWARRMAEAAGAPLDHWILTPTG